MLPKIDWKLLLFEGVVLVMIGMIALFHPFLMAVSIEILLGSLLVVAGIVQGVRVLKDVKGPGTFPLIIGALFALIAGGILLMYPLTGVLTLTLLLAIFFFVDGIAKLVNGWQYRPLRGSGWLMFSGMISIALAALIMTGFPTSAVWVIGVYFGIYLLFLGVSLITVSLYVKNPHSSDSQKKS